jgi:hypothetical protein
MQIKKALVIGVRSLAVCLLLTVCMTAGLFLSGLNRVAPQGQPAQQISAQTPSQSAPAGKVSTQAPPEAQPAPGAVLLPLLTVSLCVGIMVSYLILRSSWRGWTLVLAMFAGVYGISTVVNQLDSMFFLSRILPRGMIPAIFLQGAITAALFVPLAVWVLGKWRGAMPAVAPSTPARMGAASAAWRIALLVIAFVFLYMFFGYYVAWQNPELRKFYSGHDWPSFFASLKGNWQDRPWLYALATFRALLYVAFVYPLIRMLHAGRWESAIATALFLASWTTMLLLPNSVMPASVARSHFWETFGFSLVFGALLGWLLSAPPSAAMQGAPAAT